MESVYGFVLSKVLCLRLAFIDLKHFVKTLYKLNKVCKKFGMNSCIA